MRGLGIGILVTALILSVAFRGRGEMTDAQVKERARELGMEDKYQSGTLAQMDEENKAAAKVNNDEPAEAESDDVAAADTQAESKPDEAAEAESGDAAEVGSDDAAAADAKADVKTEEAAEVGNDDAAAADAQADVKPEEAADTKSDEAAEDAKQEEKAETPADAKSEESPVSDSNTETKAGATSDVTFVINSGEGSDTVAAHLEKAGLVKSGSAYDAFLCSKGYDRKLRAGSHVIPAGADEEQIAKILMQMPAE